MSGFVVVFHCEDCTGNDPLGCYDGQPWTLEDDDGKTRVFATAQEAEDAAEEDGEVFSPIEYKVVPA